MGRPHQKHSSPKEKEDKFNLYIKKNFHFIRQVSEGW